MCADRVNVDQNEALDALGWKAVLREQALTNRRLTCSETEPANAVVVYDPFDRAVTKGTFSVEHNDGMGLWHHSVVYAGKLACG
jgi:hypothetical protein